MAAAVVGDDVFGEDPTVNLLQRRCADLLGKEAALFVPTGTMANLLAILAQTRPGDSVFMHRDAHPFRYESGNLGMIAGVLVHTLDGERGLLSVDALKANVTISADHHFSPPALATVENTTNRGGGAPYPLQQLEEVARAAREMALSLHMDGARLFNACVAEGVGAAQYARQADTVSFCFSKGLGAPVGSILAGTEEVIDHAHRFRKMLGGGMRQAGVLAAAALHALDHHVERLGEDHDRARRFRHALEGIDGVSFPYPTPTNIVYVDLPMDADRAVEALAAHGVGVLQTGPRQLRIVFHLDVDDEGLQTAVDAFKAVAA
jgi:threonine aldolase